MRKRRGGREKFLNAPKVTTAEKTVSINVSFAAGEFQPMIKRGAGKTKKDG
jgi:hypothetical protein